MKKLLSVMLIIGGLVAASSAVTMAVEDLWTPTLMVTPETGEPGFEFTATVTDCAPDFLPPAAESESDPPLGEVEFSITGTDGTIGDPVIVPCPFPSKIASTPLKAPDKVGTYTVRAVVSPDSGQTRVGADSEIRRCGEIIENGGVELDDFWFGSCLLTAQITVTAPTTTTTSTTTTTTTTSTTTSTTIAPTTTTAATTTTVVDDSGAAVPTTTTVTDAPVVTLPATGPGDSGVAWMALLLLVAGAALTVGARSRRENTSA